MLPGQSPARIDATRTLSVHTPTQHCDNILEHPGKWLPEGAAGIVLIKVPQQHIVHGYYSKRKCERHHQRVLPQMEYMSDRGPDHLLQPLAAVLHIPYGLERQRTWLFMIGSRHTRRTNTAAMVAAPP